MLCRFFLKYSRDPQLDPTGLHLLLLLHQCWAAFNSCCVLVGLSPGRFIWCWGGLRIITVRPGTDGGHLPHCRCRMCTWELHLQKRCGLHLISWSWWSWWGKLHVWGCRWHSYHFTVYIKTKSKWTHNPLPSIQTLAMKTGVKMIFAFTYY